jgi:hypothetical protein
MLQMLQDVKWDILNVTQRFVFPFKFRKLLLNYRDSVFGGWCV